MGYNIDDSLINFDVNNDSYVNCHITVTNSLFIDNRHVCSIFRSDDCRGFMGAAMFLFVMSFAGAERPISEISNCVFRGNKVTVKKFKKGEFF